MVKSVAARCCSQASRGLRTVRFGIYAFLSATRNPASVFDFTTSSVVVVAPDQLHIVIIVASYGVENCPARLISRSRKLRARSDIQCVSG
jgi:hypothetical protein